jgi:hypothetical protein
MDHVTEFCEALWKGDTRTTVSGSRVPSNSFFSIRKAG